MTRSIASWPAIHATFVPVGKILFHLFWSEAENAWSGEGVKVCPEQGGVVGQEGGHGVEEALLAVQVVVVAGVPLVDTHQLPVQTPAGG